MEIYVGNLHVASKEAKMRENRLRWFGHVRRRPVDATVRTIDRLEITGTLTGEEDLRKLGRNSKTDIKTLI